MIQVLNSVRAGLVPDEVGARLRRLAGEDGQAFVEYALLLLFVAVALVVTATFTNFITDIGNALTTVGGKLNSAS